MRVLVVRHGIALARAEAGRGGVSDAERPLTDKGRRRMRQVARGLEKLVLDVGAIVSSPLRRATETAEALELVYGLQRSETAALLPDAAPEELARVLGEISGSSPLCVVGHEPHLSEWVGFCLFGQARSALELKKGGACLLGFDGAPGPGTGRLEWLLTPGILRRV